MTAKIKNRSRHTDQHHRPKNVSLKAFERAYWPYLPLALFVTLLVASFTDGSIHRLSTQPFGTILAGIIAVLAVF